MGKESEGQATSLQKQGWGSAHELRMAAKIDAPDFVDLWAPELEETEGDTERTGAEPAEVDGALLLELGAAC